MIHACAYVVIPPDGDPHDLVAAVLDPWCEDRGRQGWWDWWQIGGRFTGEFDDYDPQTDPANIDADGRVEWPTQWVHHPGDIVPVATLIALLREPKDYPYTFMAGEAVLHRSVYDYEARDWITNDSFDADVLAVLSAVDPAWRVVIVDYHS